MLISCKCSKFIVGKRDKRKTSDARKRDYFGFMFKTISSLNFFKYSAKKVFCFLGNIFNKVKRAIVQKPDAGRAYN